MIENFPYVSQIDSAPRHNECGLACVEMFFRWLGISSPGVTKLSIEYDPPDDGTTTADLKRVLSDYGLTPIEPSLEAYPYIELVGYKVLPALYNQEYDGLHWIVRTGDTTYNDPYWPGTQGSNLAAAKSTLDKCISRVGVLQSPARTATVVSDAPYLTIRSGPDIAQPPVGFWKNGSNISITAQAKDSRGRTWYQTSSAVADAYTDKAMTSTYSVKLGWCAGWLISTGSSTPILGLNVLNGGPGADRCMALGAKAISLTFNPGHAARLKATYPSAYVVARPTDCGGSITEWMRVIEIDSLPRGTICLGLNEGDTPGFGQGTVKEIMDRAHFDESCWNECKKRGLIYAGGSFSVANPNITDYNIAQAVRQYYAPLVNSGMWLNQHTYIARDGTNIPAMKRFSTDVEITLFGKTLKARQSTWTAEMWRLYFAFCGFDPRLATIISDECGIEGDTGMSDAPISGGFAANPQLDMKAFMREYQRVQGLQCWFGDNGGWYPSPFKFGLVFCSNGGDRWAGYNVEPDAFKELF